MSERGVSAGSTVRQAPPRLRVGAAGRPSRGPSRPSRWPATLLAVLLAAPLPLCAWAQTPAGMIVIPGNGEPAGGNAANGTTRSTGAGSAAGNGEIVIPGNGEPGARHSAMNIVTVPPGADTQPLHPAGTAGSAASTGSRLSQDNAAIVAASARLREAATSASASVQHASAAPRPELTQLQQQAATELQQVAQRPRLPAPPIGGAPTMPPMPSPSTIPPGANLGAVAPFGMRAAVLNAKVSSASGTAATDARAAAADPHAGAAGAAALAGSQANPANAFNARAQIAGAGQAAQAAAPDGAQPGQTSQQAARGGAQPAQALQQTARDGVQPTQVLQQAARNGAQPDQALRQATRNGAQPVTVTRDAVNTVNVSATPNAAPAGASVPHSVEVVRAAVPAPAPSPVQAPLAGTEDPDLIIQSATDFLRQQVTGLPGKVTVSIPPISPRGLASCANLSAAMAPGAPLWGRTTVAVRCASDKPWTFYMTAHVSVFATYYVAGRTILPGDVIQVGDLVPRDGDLSVMPRAIVTDPQQAIGAVAQNRLSAGMPLRSDLIRSPMAIELGQTVQVVAQGNGFSISTDGNAMNNASPGQQVKVKTSGGQVVVGTAAARGIVQIPM